MLVNDNKNVRTCAGVILWDGITQPEQNDDGSIAHSIKIAIPESAPEKAELEQLANASLASSDFKGVMPPGGNWPIMNIDVSKLGDSAPLMAGRVAINAKTRNGTPSIFDANGQELSAMQFGRMLYPGAVVELLVHCYSFNNKSKGVAYGLDGIMIIDATTPKLDVGGGMAPSQVAAAFGAGGGGQAQAAAQVHTAANGAVITPPPTTVQPDESFVANAANPVTPPPPPQQPAHVMTAAAQGSYDDYIAQGWTDELLVANGLMQA